MSFAKRMIQQKGLHEYTSVMFNKMLAKINRIDKFEVDSVLSILGLILQNIYLLPYLNTVLQLYYFFKST